MPLNFNEDKKLLKQITENRLLMPLEQPRLLGSCFNSFSGICNNCDIKLNNMPVCIMRKTPELDYHKIYYLCQKCRAINRTYIMFYFILK